MTCGGCKAKAEARARWRTNAVMCLCCPERVWTTCNLTQLTVREMAIAGNCPAGRHIDKDGVVRLGDGVRVYGVPAWFRVAYWLLALVGAITPLSGPLGGCGCLKRLKDLVARSSPT